jgi:hypothetical protein
MKRIALALAAAAAFVSTTATTLEAGAANYTLYIHGRNTGTATQAGNYADFSYWGAAASATGVNPKAVNWNGTGYISDTNGGIRDALDRFCTGGNWCYVGVHSAGGAQIGYAMSLYGATTRNVVDPGTGAATGQTQVGWNIKWVAAAASAAGGTELADMGYWAVSDYLTNDLRTGTIRPMYNHNATQGKTFAMFAGASGTLYSGTLPGQDDEVVAYHSSLGASSTASICNWSDWFCDNYGRINSGSYQWYYGGNSLYSYHAPKFVDQGESYNHYTNSAWGGIVSQMRSYMATNAAQ